MSWRSWVFKSSFKNVQFLPQKFESKTQWSKCVTTGGGKTLTGDNLKGVRNWLFNFKLARFVAINALHGMKKTPASTVENSAQGLSCWFVCPRCQVCRDAAKCVTQIVLKTTPVSPLSHFLKLSLSFLSYSLPFLILYNNLFLTVSLLLYRSL